MSRMHFRGFSTSKRVVSFSLVFLVANVRPPLGTLSGYRHYRLSADSIDQVFRLCRGTNNGHSDNEQAYCSLYL